MPHLISPASQRGPVQILVECRLLIISGTFDNLGEKWAITLHPYLTMLPNFTQGFRQILAGVLQMERDWEEAASSS